MIEAAEAATDVQAYGFEASACCEGGRMQCEDPEDVAYQRKQPLGDSEQLASAPFEKCEPRLLYILGELAALSASKGSDYANVSEAYSNMRAASEWGLPDYQLCCMRIDEKMRRIKNFCQRGYLKNESLEDSLLDIALLACIGAILFREAAENEA